MDAADQAELAWLRRRAYGPAPDIDGDGAALRRLIELEERALSAPAAAEEPAPDPRTSQPHAPAPVHPGRRRPALPSALIGAAVLALLVAGGIPVAPDSASTMSGIDPPATAYRASLQAYSLAHDPDAVTLLHIPIDGSFGNDMDLPSSEPLPVFPTTGSLEWASHLGEYFGWEVWIGAAAGAVGTLQREHCILIERGAIVRGRCVPALLRPQSALVVAAPYTLMDARERPVGMSPGERVGFWWGYDRSITVLVGDGPQ